MGIAKDKTETLLKNVWLGVLDPLLNRYSALLKVGLVVVDVFCSSSYFLPLPFPSSSLSPKDTLKYSLMLFNHLLLPPLLITFGKKLSLRILMIWVME